VKTGLRERNKAYFLSLSQDYLPTVGIIKPNTYTEINSAQSPAATGNVADLNIIHSTKIIGQSRNIRLKFNVVSTMKHF
jgi:hypothetical protein